MNPPCGNGRRVGSEGIQEGWGGHASKSDPLTCFGPCIPQGLKTKKGRGGDWVKKKPTTSFKELKKSEGGKKDHQQKKKESKKTVGHRAMNHNNVEGKRGQTQRARKPWGKEKTGNSGWVVKIWLKQECVGSEYG